MGANGFDKNSDAGLVIYAHVIEAAAAASPGACARTTNNEK